MEGVDGVCMQSTSFLALGLSTNPNRGGLQLAGLLRGMDATQVSCRISGEVE